MQFLTALINLVRRDEEGQGLAEYALILALIAIVAIIALIFLGTQVSGILSTVGARSNDRSLDSVSSAQDRRAFGPAVLSCPAPLAHLAHDLSPSVRSSQLLPVVLAHSYSRRPSGRC